MPNDVTHKISIDRTEPLSADPGTGHNRWHPDVTPILTVDPGDTVEIETRDAYDGQIGPGSRAADLTSLDPGRTHPMTGPVFVRGAEPGDILEVEILAVEPQAFGFTVASPAGILARHIPEPKLVLWHMAGGFATSADLPGVRIPASPFLGLMGVAPSHSMLAHFRVMEERLAACDPSCRPILPAGAVPASAAHGLRTVPPRDNAGNVDIRQLTAGAILRLPVSVEGALFSCGDAHFAQGDNECCTGIEMGATLRCRFSLAKGEAARRNIRDLQFYRREGPDAPPQRPRPTFGTTGQSYTRDGSLNRDDLNRAAEHALVNMIDHIGHEYGLSRTQAAVVCSLVVDLRISQAVNSPNYLVTALLPTDVFVTP